MFFSVMELMTGKSHIIEAESIEKASKYYNKSKYIVVPTDPVIDARDSRVNGKIRESIDPIETLKPADRKPQPVPKVWDGSSVDVIIG